jgi:hypothetical protein
MRHLILILMFPLAAAPCAAQGAEQLVPGVRVRLRAPAAFSGELTATAIRRANDTLYVADARGLQVAVPFASISRLEINRGKDRGHGALIGALWGGAIGFAMGAFGDSNPPETSRAQNMAEGALGGALIGAGIGAAVGSDRWQRVELPVGIAIAPTRTGFALRVMFQP